MKKTTFFGAAKTDKLSKEYLYTIRIGEILAENEYTVHCGGYGGFMEAVSCGVYNKGGKVVGHLFHPYTKGNKYLSLSILHNDLFDRLKELITDTDIFIVQIGGVGTLTELFLTLDVIRKMNKKPKIYLIGSIWNDMIKNDITFKLLLSDFIQYLEVIENINILQKHLEN